MKKKVVTLSLVVALIATAAIGGTFAYFTDKTETKANVFTVGNVDITLTEEAWDASGSKDAPEVYPGEALAKDPVVHNVGKNPCFVRVSVTGLDSLKKVGADEIKLRGLDTENWKKIGNYYYYKHVVAAKDDNSTLDDTTALFTHIIMPTDLENGDGATEFSVDVYAEAVQAQGARPSFSDVQAMTFEEIAEWFGTCGL